MITLIKLYDGIVVIVSLLTISLLASYIRKFSVDSYAIAISIKFAKFIDSGITFIGVIHHELSHILLALLTGARIKNFKLFKLFGDTLGEVNIIPRGNVIFRSIQLTASAIAPVICGSISIYLIYKHLGLNIITLILITNIAYHMTLSKQDINAAFKGSIMTILLFFIIFYFIDINILIYIGAVKIILTILGINFIIALLFRLVYMIRKK